VTRHQLEPDDAGIGKRLDQFLATALPDLSRARIQDLLREGHITVDQKPARPSMKCRAGMQIAVTIPPPVPAEPQAEDIPLDILYEDSHLIVINKPAGLVVHPAAGHEGGTLVNALLHHCEDLGGIGGEERPGIVHRLDKLTSGVMVVAKHDQSMQQLVEQFKTRRVAKTYLAIVWGTPSPESGTLETLIGRSPVNRKKMSTEPRQGKTAITHYRVLERFRDCSLVECRIETGRTHQIRVHMAYIKHPILGDPEYGGSRASRRPDAVPPGIPAPTRQLLHAAELSIDHPHSGERCTFRAPLPDDMETLLQLVRP
jgi:23S rRNA pseudouridine1911/1915/1917 synthase